MAEADSAVAASTGVAADSTVAVADIANFSAT
jgi:hypothetical protein